MFNDWLGREGLYKSIVFIAAVFVGFLTTHMNVSAAPKAKQIDFWDDSEELTKLKINHAAWDALLKKHVIVDHPSGVNRFNYEAVTASDSAALDQYIEYLQRMEPRQYPKRCQKAYWLNLFNAGIVQQVLKSRSSIDSIKDLGGRLWKRKRFYIAMQKTSFDDIEHGILRPIFKDPRVHFSLAAGTIGSANILPEAFTTANVEDLLEQNTREFLTHPRGVSLQDEALVLSTIFKWYSADFGGDLDGVKKFIEPYVSEILVPTLSQARRAKYEYDWSLNKPE